MPEGTNHTPAQNRASDAKARALIPPRLETFSVIYSNPPLHPSCQLGAGAGASGTSAGLFYRQPWPGSVHITFQYFKCVPTVGSSRPYLLSSASTFLTLRADFNFGLHFDGDVERKFRHSNGTPCVSADLWPKQFEDKIREAI